MQGIQLPQSNERYRIIKVLDENHNLVNYRTLKLIFSSKFGGFFIDDIDMNKKLIDILGDIRIVNSFLTFSKIYFFGYYYGGQINYLRCGRTLYNKINDHFDFEKDIFKKELLINDREIGGLKNYDFSIILDSEEDLPIPKDIESFVKKNTNFELTNHYKKISENMDLIKKGDPELWKIWTKNLRKEKINEIINE
jgi:hypothetical protein